MTIKPLKKRTMGLAELRRRAYSALKKCVKQFRRKAYEEGLSDEEFIDKEILPLLADIEQDKQIEKMQKDAGTL